MRILVFHGYLLRGTGSNVYNAELARALAAAGHEVHLFSQDLRPAELAFVDAVGEWGEGGALAVRELERDRPDGWGGCTVYRPAIGRVLPVYVADRYEGFEALTFDLLTEQQLDRYLAINATAVREVAELAEVECALANHLVMGPAILARGLPAALPYAVKVHGSALEYTVRPHPRFMPYAREGLDRAATVLVGSLHTARRLWDTIADETLPARTFLGPPGVDVGAFRPRNKPAQAAGLQQLQTELQGRERAGFGPEAAAHLDRVFAGLAVGERRQIDGVAAALTEVRSAFDPAGIDVLAPQAAQAVLTHDGPLVTYVGKLIASKGVELLIAALPLVAQHLSTEHLSTGRLLTGRQPTGHLPAVRLAVVGFGNFREGLELLVRALAAGDLALARAIAGAGRELEGGEPGDLPQLAAFLESLTGEERRQYIGAARGLETQISWFGRIEHDLLVHLVTASDVQVVPSTFPEAFGMVAAEAAACAVPPICAHHSGLAEVTDQIATALPPEDGELLAFNTGDGAVRELAERLADLLADDPRRARIGRQVAKVAAERFSWTGVAQGVAAAAHGDHASLRKPV